MIKNKKFSLSILNSLLLVVFLIIVSLFILLSTYLSTKEIIKENTNTYFKQTFNLTKIILEHEQSILDNISIKVNNKLGMNNNIEDIDKAFSEIYNLDLLDDIDLLFVEKNNKAFDYSNSLFDTKLIINKLVELNLRNNKSLVSIKINNKDILLMLSYTKVIDVNTGRVGATFYVGKILNDNFSLLNKIKEKAKIEDLYIFFNQKLVSTTSDIRSTNENKLNIGINNKIVFSKKSLLINNDKKLDFIFTAKNSSFNSLEDSFIEQSLYLLLFVVISFIFLYFLSNKLIINPFMNLLSYAHKVKDNDSVKYNETNVLEFDLFSKEIEKIINEIKELKERYSRASDGVQDGLWDVDLKKNKFFYSSRFIEMLGYSKADDIHSISFWKNSIHKEDYLNTKIELKKHLLKKNKSFEKEYRFKLKDGSYKWIKIRGKAFYDQAGNLKRLTGFHTDISDIVLLKEENSKKEQLLYEQSKLTSMGEVISNIAHQWRQPLNVISLVASSISINLDLGKLDKASTKEDLEMLLERVQYLSNIIDKFRNFFNPDNKFEYFFIDDAIKDNLEIFEASYKAENIKLILDLQKIELSGYKFELMQVIINIINNSKDAFLYNNENINKKLVFINTIKEEEKLIIKIHDNAGGIEAEVKTKIYEPYFTTKHQSQGTGLGLYMSNEIIQKHFKGKLSNRTISFEYENESFRGEEFSIEIPLKK